MTSLCAALAAGACGGQPAPRPAPSAGPGAGAAAAADAAPEVGAPVAATLVVRARQIGEDRTVNVYTPPGYDDDPTTRYPVMYMPDGGLDEDFPHVSATLDALIRAGTVRPMLLVGVDNTERRRDMTGPTEVASDREIAPRVGGSAAFRAFWRDDLIPTIRARYRVTAEAGIIGESAAGLFIVETFLLEPELFTAYVALSPSLWWNADWLVTNAARLLAAHAPAPRRLFLASADEDNVGPQTARLAEVLRVRADPSLRWQYQPRPDLTHGTIYRALSATGITAVFGIDAADAPPRPTP